MEFKILKKGNRFVANHLINKKITYGWIDIPTGKFVGDTRCIVELYNHLTDYRVTQLTNSQLRFDVEKIKSYDRPIAIETEVDNNFDDPYTLEINDNSYFYTNEQDRNNDFDLIKKILA